MSYKLEEYWSVRYLYFLYLATLVHRVDGVLGLSAPSTLVPQHTEYYLKYKVRVYLWCWVLKKSYLWSLYSCEFIVHSHDGYSSKSALIKMDNPCMLTRVVVDSIDVVSRLEATFVCLVPYDWGVGSRWWQPCSSLIIPHIRVQCRDRSRRYLGNQV